MMKTRFFISLFVCTLVLFGCSEPETVRMVTGSYSYKTSGNVKIDDSLQITLQLPQEIGQLSIISVRDTENKDSVILTFNPLGGQVFTAAGNVVGKNIEITPFSRYLNLEMDKYKVEISGEATRYDNTLVFEWTYVGKGLVTQLPLESENVTTIAQIN